MRAPSIKTLVPLLTTNAARCEDPVKAAREIRSLLHAGHIRRALEAYDRAAGNHGLEYLRETDDIFCRRGVEYSNTGDTYAPTLCWDRSRGTVRVCSWGDIVEANSGRFE